MFFKSVKLIFDNINCRSTYSVGFYVLTAAANIPAFPSHYLKVPVWLYATFFLQSLHQYSRLRKSQIINNICLDIPPRHKPTKFSDIRSSSFKMKYSTG
jgi:hypothetical protein